MKNILIISPHFPPVNAADMHRVRHALPYFKDYNWKAEIITVDPDYIEVYSFDPLLLKSLPQDLKIHKVTAFKVKSTRKFGLGSLSMRSYFQIKKKGNQLLHSQHFDLIFFSTTAFHVMALGPYWKRKFKIPFVVDIQDPWRNDFYLEKPANERPPKFWLSYNIDKYLEAKTIPLADGIISVSNGYIETFRKRYPATVSTPSLTLPFSCTFADLKIAKEVDTSKVGFKIVKDKKNIVYIGRGGHDLKKALQIFFNAIKSLKTKDIDLYNSIHIWFIGTSYAIEEHATKTILPVAADFGVEDKVTEITNRVSYFETLHLLNKANMLFVPGSTDSDYTASKIYPYIMVEKPLLVIFHKKSSVVDVIEKTKAGICITFDDSDSTNNILKVRTCASYIKDLLDSSYRSKTDLNAFEPYTANAMTDRMLNFFDDILTKNQ